MRTRRTVIALACASILLSLTAVGASADELDPWDDHCEWEFEFQQVGYLPGFTLEYNLDPHDARYCVFGY